MIEIVSLRLYTYAQHTFPPQRADARSSQGTIIPMHVALNRIIEVLGVAKSGKWSTKYKPHLVQVPAICLLLHRIHARDPCSTCYLPSTPSDTCTGPRDPCSTCCLTSTPSDGTNEQGGLTKKHTCSLTWVGGVGLEGACV